LSNTDSHPFRPDYAIPSGETLRDQPKLFGALSAQVW
jgi:hypothetical protein